jgi:hypothetical protein
MGFASLNPSYEAKLFIPIPLDLPSFPAYSPIVLLFEGRLPETCRRRSRMRRPRAGLVTPRSGGLGVPSALTMGGRLQWLDEAGMKAGETPPDAGSGPKCSGHSQPGRTGQGLSRTPHVERREALLSLARREGTPPQVSRTAFNEAAQGSDRKDPAFPGAPPPRLGGAPRPATAYPAPQRTRAAARARNLRYSNPTP